MVNAIRVTSILSAVIRRCCHAADEALFTRLYPMLNTRRARAMGDDRRDDDFLTGAAASLLLLLLAVAMILLLLLKRSDDAAVQYFCCSLGITFLDEIMLLARVGFRT